MPTADTPLSLHALSERGLTPRELGKYLRVSPDRVRAWINSGELSALNTVSTRCGKPRYVILPHHLAEFEQGRQACPFRKPLRRKRQSAAMDFYPD
jgi:hypothetical protein